MCLLFFFKSDSQFSRNAGWETERRRDELRTRIRWSDSATGAVEPATVSLDLMGFIASALERTKCVTAPETDD